MLSTHQNNTANASERQGKTPTLLVDYLHTGSYRIGPELADRILAEASYDRQRKVGAQTVANYAELMRRNYWLDHSQIAFGSCEGRLYLINGQHRLHAIIAAKDAFTFSVVVYPCDNVQNVAKLYTRFDTAIRTRSTAQILSAIGLAELGDISKQTAGAVYRAIPIINNGMNAHRITKGIVPNMLDAAGHFLPQAKLFDECTKGADYTTAAFLRSGGAMAVALMTLKYEPIKAVEFWKGVALNEGMTKGDPRASLRTTYLTRELQMGNGTVLAPLVAWNAFYKGDKLSTIRFGKKTTVRLYGTPIGRRRA